MRAATRAADSPGRMGEHAGRWAAADSEAALMIATKRTARRRFIVMATAPQPFRVLQLLVVAPLGAGVPRSGQVACQRRIARCAPVSGRVMCADAGGRAVCPSPRATPWPNTGTGAKVKEQPPRGCPRRPVGGSGQLLPRPAPPPRGGGGPAAVCSLTSLSRIAFISATHFL